MERSLLKQSIDEWHDLLEKSRNSLFDRQLLVPIPTLDFAVALTGIRRCGKTHIAFQMSKDIPISAILYYNFEDPLFYSDNKIENLDLLLSVAQEFRSEKISLLILDEIHVVDGWERWLRKLIDQKRYRIIVTGSSAKLLSSELATSLTGRAIEYRVWPLSLKEVIRFKGIKSNSSSELNSLLRETLEWGSLPEVVKLSIDNKKKLLRQYLNDILLKDVISRNQIRNKRALDQIITYYLTNISSLHSYNSISKAYAFDTVTALEYTRMLTEAFLVFEVFRYHSNLKVQSRDSKKIYIADLGFRKVGARSINDDTEKLLENFIYIELLRREKEVCYFKGKQEVDFVIVDNYKPIEVIQVCSSNLSEKKTWEREINATLEALEYFKLKSGLILSYDREETLEIENKIINIRPTYKWLCDIN